MITKILLSIAANKQKKNSCDEGFGVKNEEREFDLSRVCLLLSKSVFLCFFALIFFHFFSFTKIHKNHLSSFFFSSKKERKKRERKIREKK